MCEENFKFLGLIILSILTWRRRWNVKCIRGAGWKMDRGERLTTSLKATGSFARAIFDANWNFKILVNSGSSILRYAPPTRDQNFEMYTR